MGNDQSKIPTALDGGKGSVQRPVNREKFEENWDKIFNKEKFDEDFDRVFGVEDDGKSGC